MSSGDTDVTTERLEQRRSMLRAPVTFCGTYRHHIDEKGRVAIPAQLRRFLPEGSVVAPGPRPRLMIWPPEEWAMQKDLFRRTAETPAQERRFMRRLTGNSSLFEVDAQGRLLLSAQHRAFAQIVDHGRLRRARHRRRGRSPTSSGSPSRRSSSPAEFTQVWDLVHQRGTSASPSPA